MEIETGPCAEFSVYHLMELEHDEEHLLRDHEAEQALANGWLIRSSTQIIGTGQLRPPQSPADIIGKLSLQQKSISHERKSVARKTHQEIPSSPAALVDLCRVFRSKNAGPYEITIDAIFHTEADYQRIKSSGILSREKVAHYIGIPADDIIWMGFYDPARAFKVTFPRVRSQKHKSAGGFMENDVHGSQEHTGLAQLPLRSGKGLTALAMWLNAVNRRLLWKALVASVAGVSLIHLARRVANRQKKLA